MGYEITMLVGILQGDDRWVKVIATMELSGVGGDTNIAAIDDKRDGEPCYVFDVLDGNQTFTSDNVSDKPLVAVPVETVIHALRVDVRATKYRRFIVALTLLESLTEHFTEPLHCVLFGH